jgi:hypothetical protein
MALQIKRSGLEAQTAARSRYPCFHENSLHKKGRSTPQLLGLKRAERMQPI